MIVAESMDRSARRLGFVLVETTLAIVLLATIVLLTLQLVAWVASDRQAIARREAATGLVANVMEKILTRPPATISTEALAPLIQAQRSHLLRSAGVLRVEVSSQSPIDGLTPKRIVVEVRWSDQLPGVGAPVRLVAWAFARQGVQP